MKLRRPLSLLEVTVALAILMLAAGAISWKAYSLLEKKRFQTSLSQFKSRMQTVQKMAMNMQADWEGVLQFDGKYWTFQTTCLDSSRLRSFSPIRLQAIEVVLYPARPETWNLTQAKTAKISDRQQVNMNNMDLLTIDDSSELSRGPKSQFQTAPGINGKSQKSYQFTFFSSGEVWPIGTLLLKGREASETATLELLTLFNKEEGDGVQKLGPVCPRLNSVHGK